MCRFPEGSDTSIYKTNIMKINIFILICLLFPLALAAQDFSTYQNRKIWIFEQTKDIELLESGKHGMPKAVIRLHHDPHDPAALDYLTHVLDNRHQNMFDFPGMALALCRYKDSFTPAQLLKIQHSLERLAKPDKNAGEGFLGHGTENHATIMWASAYLFGQIFPDAKWANGMTSKQLMAETKEWMRRAFKGYYDHGYTEYLSTTYELAMNHPIQILLEYAKDPEMKAIAEAYMLYKWSVISLNLFEGVTIAPFGRMNTQQDHNPEEVYVTAAPYSNWLLWGWGAAMDNMKLINFKKRINEPVASDITFMLYTVLSKVDPDEIFFRLGVQKEPMSLKTSAATFGHYGGGAPHMMMRKVFRNKTYAIGTGNFRWVPGGDYADHDTDGFGIIWSSADRFNYLQCYSPFWYSDGDDPDRTPDTWYKGTISPFQQTAHHKNAVVTLFDIPDKDPWPGLPSPEKWAWRDGHAGNLLKRGMIRFPKSVDEMIEENGWIFLREGKTYVGIKPLKDYYIQKDLTGKGLTEFVLVKSDHAKTGFVFEAGSEEESGSFEQFRKKLPKNSLSVDWNKMTAGYTSSQKDRIQIRYIPGFPFAEVPENQRPDYWPRLHGGVTGLVESVPEVTINGKREIPYQQWPMIESPSINMNNSILKINGENPITVDWQGALPIIKRGK